MNDIVRKALTGPYFSEAKTTSHAAHGSSALQKKPNTTASQTLNSAASAFTKKPGVVVRRYGVK